ncbi:cytidine deaminase-like protein [Auriculariales sp. MPI-PUGE-AT-0066]|nr:cytidine deaminase-like protein [Auriculariales sp. MPI-PUGE-AT-0066]
MPSESKSNLYLSHCEEAAMKSPMCFTLGAVLVKGGKILGTGYNHHRTQYDGGRGGKRPVSMHAEMHAIYNASGARQPAFKTQCVQQRRDEGEWRLRCVKAERKGLQPRVSRPSQRTRPSASQLHRFGRVHGADLYVARFTKQGFGTASPCWRCLAWCRWAGVKRVFHYDGTTARFEVVKVNAGDAYETHADGRLFSGAVFQ